MPKPAIGDPDYREPYRVDSHHGAAHQREAPEVSPSPCLEERRREGQGHRQEDEPGGHLVLRQAGDELAAEAEARGVEVDQEEERVQAPAHERGPLAPEDRARQRVDRQERHHRERRVHVAED
jgi:hypothetical protein